MIRHRYITPSDPIAFSGVTNIKRYFQNKKVDHIKDILATVPAYTLHREAKRVKHHNPFFIYRKREHIQMDLIDMANLARWNNGVRFLLVAIDGFTKKAWVEPLLNKKGVTTLHGINNIISRMVTPPMSIFFDRGSEFINQNVRDALIQANIHIQHPNSELKAAIAERFNRSLQDLIFKYLTQNETRKYIDLLPDLLMSYNTRGHRTLRYMSPEEAELEENKTHVISALNHYYTKVTTVNTKIKFAVGDIVRIRRAQTKFTRGYHERFTRELFKIIEVQQRMPIPTYKLKSLDKDDTIQGGFYNNELQKVLGDIYKVEKILKRRTRNGKPQIYVKWLDFGSAHNSWIDESDITEVYNNHGE